MSWKHGKMMIIFRIPQSLHLQFVNLRKPAVLFLSERVWKDNCLQEGCWKIATDFMYIYVGHPRHVDGFIMFAISKLYVCFVDVSVHIKLMQLYVALHRPSIAVGPKLFNGNNSHLALNVEKITRTIINTGTASHDFP